MDIKKVLALVLTCAGLCSQPALAEDPIEVLYYDLADPFIQELKTKLDEQAKQQQLVLNSYDGKHQAATQLPQIGQALASHHTLLLNLVEASEVDNILREAQRSQTRVIFFNRVPKLDSLSRFADAWYVGSDEKHSGVMQAEVIRDYFKAHPEVDHPHAGKYKALLIKGESHNRDAELRSVTVLESLQREKFELEILDVMYCNWSEYEAYQAVQVFLQHYPAAELDLIICNNDAMALGAIQALNEQGYNLGKEHSKTVPVFGVDGFKPGLDAIAAGKLQGSIKQNLALMAEFILRLASGKTEAPKLAAELGLKLNGNIVQVPYQRIAD